MIATPWPHDGAPGDCDDGLRLQRIVSHVLVSARAGELPGLPWDLGLSGAERAHVVARWPAGAAAWDALRPGTVDAPPPLLMPLRGLLLAHRADASPALVVLTNALACACFGGYHLWQDLGATGRDEVSACCARASPRCTTAMCTTCAGSATCSFSSARSSAAKTCARRSATAVTTMNSATARTMMRRAPRHGHCDTARTDRRRRAAPAPRRPESGRHAPLRAAGRDPARGLDHAGGEGGGAQLQGGVGRHRADEQPRRRGADRARGRRQGRRPHPPDAARRTAGAQLRADPAGARVS